MTALINIGKKLPHVPTKDKKSKKSIKYNASIITFELAQNLISEMKRMNMNLPARVWIPFHTFPHHVVRIAYTESTVLNSRDRVCFKIFFNLSINLIFLY
jgi:phosphatidylinositol 4-kinase